MKVKSKLIELEKSYKKGKKVFTENLKAMEMKDKKSKKK